jgi:hypothetical protein
MGTSRIEFLATSQNRFNTDSADYADSWGLRLEDPREHIREIIKARLANPPMPVESRISTFRSAGGIHHEFLPAELAVVMVVPRLRFIDAVLENRPLEVI